MKKIKFIQLIGTQRSGSNLLRLMLDQLPEVAAPHPPHILKVFSTFIHSYGNLSLRTNRVKLASDILYLVRNNPVPWEGFTIDAEKLADEAPQHSLTGVFTALYQAYAKTKNANVVCCKSMANIFFFRELEDLGLRPYYIYLYRDGRDVASSFRHTIVGPKHIYFLADKWKKEQEACLSLKQQLGRKRFLAVSYEDLVTNPEKVLHQICDRIGLHYNDKMLRYHQSSASQIASAAGSMWENLAKPLIKNNIGKYVSDLLPQEITMFEDIAGEQLRKLNYSCTVKERLQVYDQLKIADFYRLDQTMRKEVEKRMPRNELDRRQRYQNAIKKIDQQMNKKIKI